jgi:hypothetical protein
MKQGLGGGVGGGKCDDVSDGGEDDVEFVCPCCGVSLVRGRASSRLLLLTFPHPPPPTTTLPKASGAAGWLFFPPCVLCPRRWPEWS